MEYQIFHWRPHFFFFVHTTILFHLFARVLLFYFGIWWRTLGEKISSQILGALQVFGLVTSVQILKHYSYLRIPAWTWLDQCHRIFLDLISFSKAMRGLGHVARCCFIWISECSDKGWDGLLSRRKHETNT